MATQGRNALCRCGSGRKYKNCHLRRDKEQETLVATAIHEAGHVIASFHYGVSIGEQGVFITDEGSGFTDSNKTEKWGVRRIIELEEDVRMAHFVILVIGGVTEFRHRQMMLEDIEQKHIKYWVTDFAGAIGCQGSCRTSTSAMFSPGEYQAACRLTHNCFVMLARPEGATARVSLGGTDVGSQWDHQGDVGDASYASIPELVRIHRKRGAADWNLYAMVAIIELARTESRNPEVPEWLRDDHFRSIQELAQMGTKDILSADESETKRAILSVIAIAKGLRTHGKFLVAYSEDELSEMEP